MNRRYYLDTLPGERRAVVTLDGRPERLFIDRTGEPDGPALGARYAARVLRIDRGLGMAFLSLGDGLEAVMASGRLAIQQGSLVEVEITAEARRHKAAIAVFDGPSARQPGLVRPALDAAERLARLASGAAVVEGIEARDAADEAEEAALQVEHALPMGGALTIEPTRALVAVDVDQGARFGGDPAYAARQTNLAAIDDAARLLRLKSLGGLVVLDLVGKGQAGELLVSAARKAFAPDQPGVVLGPVSRLGTLTLALPQRLTPISERLLDGHGLPTPRTQAQRLLRRLEREGRADPGGRIQAACAPEVAIELAPLAQQLGPRFSVIETLGAGRLDADITTR